jgi:hypothetical protein
MPRRCPARQETVRNPWTRSPISRGSCAKRFSNERESMSTPDVRPVGDLPDAIGKTAARELSRNGITSLERVSTHMERELLAIHGVGPKAVGILREVLAEKGLTFRSG